MITADDIENELKMDDARSWKAGADDNVTNVEPDPSKRRAMLWADGLSVFGFHEDEGYAEIGFIRPEHSLVEMRIYENGCNLFWSTERDFPYSTENLIITVNSTKWGELGSYFCDCDGRKPPVKDADFCHMPSAAKMFNRPKLKYTLFYKYMLTARLRVHDGLFYTLKKSVNDAVIYRNGKEIDRKSIGRVLAADLVCSPEEDLMVKIAKIRGRSPEVTLPPLKAPHKYEIMVRTKPMTTNNHFHHIFHVLQKPLTSLSTFDLRFMPPEPPILACDDQEPGLGPRSNDWICETVTGGGG
jgi:hypothetical protein